MANNKTTTKSKTVVEPAKKAEAKSTVPEVKSVTAVKKTEVKKEEPKKAEVKKAEPKVTTVEKKAEDKKPAEAKKDVSKPAAVKKETKPAEVKKEAKPAVKKVAEQKPAAKKETPAKKAEAKKAVKKAEVKTNLIIQTPEVEISEKDIINLGKQAWAQAGKENKIRGIKTLEAYVQPEVRKIYFVINGVQLEADF